MRIDHFVILKNGTYHSIWFFRLITKTYLIRGCSQITSRKKKDFFDLPCHKFFKERKILYFDCHKFFYPPPPLKRDVICEGPLIRLGVVRVLHNTKCVWILLYKTLGSFTYDVHKKMGILETPTHPHLTQILNSKKISLI